MYLSSLEEGRVRGNALFGNGEWDKAEDVYDSVLNDEEETRRKKKEYDGGIVIEEIEDDDPDAPSASSPTPLSTDDTSSTPPSDLFIPPSIEVLKLRAVILSNLAAARIKLEKWESAAEAATRAIDTGVLTNEKALERRAYAYAQIDTKMEDGLRDYKDLLEAYPNRTDVNIKIKELEKKIAERNEKLKDEMMDKLKQFGNFCLKPFGLSTDSFEMVPNGEGGYSVNMKKN